MLRVEQALVLLGERLQGGEGGEAGGHEGAGVVLLRVQSVLLLHDEVARVLRKEETGSVSRFDV